MFASFVENTTATRIESWIIFENANDLLDDIQRRFALFQQGDAKFECRLESATAQRFILIRPFIGFTASPTVNDNSIVFLR